MEAIDSKRGTAHVVCKHCKYVTTHSNHDSHKATGHMTKHLDACIKYKQSSTQKTQEQSQTLPELFLLDVKEDNSPVRGIMTSDKLREQVLRIIAAGNLSFSQAENPELVALLQHAYPDCTTPNRRAVATQLKQRAREEQCRLKAKLIDLDSKVSLALDIWTTRNNLAYLGTFPSYEFFAVNFACLL